MNEVWRPGRPLRLIPGFKIGDLAKKPPGSLGGVFASCTLRSYRFVKGVTASTTTKNPNAPPSYRSNKIDQERK